MGQGWCSGVRDTVNLAWKLTAVIRGKADHSLLDTYQLEREQHALRVIEMSAAVGRTVVMQNPEQAQKRDDALKAGVLPDNGSPPRLMNGIVRSPDHIGASFADGRLAPQARVLYDNRIDKSDNFVGPGWKVISRHEVKHTSFTAEQRQLISSLGMRFLHISRGACEPGSFVDIDGDFSKWYYAHECQVFLQRPDHYVFGAVKTNDDLPQLLDELRECLTRSGWRWKAEKPYGTEY